MITNLQADAPSHYLANMSGKYQVSQTIDLVSGIKIMPFSTEDLVVVENFREEDIQTRLIHSDAEENERGIKQRI